MYTDSIAVACALSVRFVKRGKRASLGRFSSRLHAVCSLVAAALKQEESREGERRHQVRRRDVVSHTTCTKKQHNNLLGPKTIIWTDGVK